MRAVGQSRLDAAALEAMALSHNYIPALPTNHTLSYPEHHPQLLMTCSIAAVAVPTA